MVKRPTKRTTNQPTSNSNDVVNENSNKASATAKISVYRAEVSRLAAIANKRIARIEKNKLTDSPAYKRLVNEGIAKFGIKGKSYNEVQKELSNINRFLNSETSTIRGMNSVLKEMASNTGVKYSNLKELRSIGNNFFRLADKVEEYLRNVDDIASAIGYQKIWEVINEYVETEQIDLSDAESKIDSMVEIVTSMIKQDDKADLSVIFGGDEIAWFY